MKQFKSILFAFFNIPDLNTIKTLLQLIDNATTKWEKEKKEASIQYFRPQSQTHHLHFQPPFGTVCRGGSKQYVW